MIIKNVFYSLLLQEDKHIQSGQKWKLPPNGQPLSLFSGHPSNRKPIIHPEDDGKYKINK